MTVHTAVNLQRLAVPPTEPAPVPERVSVLLPLRDEAHRVEPCLRALLAQRALPDVEMLVLDDGSADGTSDVVRRVVGSDPRVRLLTGSPLPAGWLGKPHACAQLGGAATGSVLVFVDADVVLAPSALAATVGLLRERGVDLVSPYPRQLADGTGPRLVQPLLQWSWLSFLPLTASWQSARPSTAAANGQLLAVDALAYRRAGGHGAVRTAVIDDVELLRAVKRAGGRGGMADGTALATCRMYADWPELRDGYTKSLWAAFGSRTGAAATIGLLGLLYLAPPLQALDALLRRRPRAAVVPLAGYVAGVTSRVLSARRTGGRVWPDSLAHPVSVATLGWLTALSWRGRRSGALSWKGRPV
ncbi:MAG: glycosyltransferase [Actinomycetota bacterium]|nr:glycosyltransferase [Actinomycetota bacterium]